MDQTDTLARLARLKAEPPEWRDMPGLRDWLLKIAEDSQLRDRFSASMAQFAEQELGLQQDEYLQWLQTPDQDSLKLRAWTYQALALYKAEQYRQAKDEPSV